MSSANYDGSNLFFYVRIRSKLVLKELKILYFLDWLRTSTWTTACLKICRLDPWCATGLSGGQRVGEARAARRCEIGPGR